MGQIITLLHESGEWAFLFGTFLYGMAFAGDVVLSKFFGVPTDRGKIASPGTTRRSEFEAAEFHLGRRL
ncbi:MAG: hypothetical protein L0387_13550 [Acidobacteria bacterium]|nr:hypothetical protein [Acidobacteriota bacterium]